MKNSTLKIIADNEHIDFAISDYYLPKSTNYSTTSKLIKENKEYYWLIMIAYKTYIPQVIKHFTQSSQKDFPEIFKDMVMNYFNISNANNQRLKNLIYSIIDNKYLIHLLEIFKELEDLVKRLLRSVNCQQKVD